MNCGASIAPAARRAHPTRAHATSPPDNQHVGHRIAHGAPHAQLHADRMQCVHARIQHFGARRLASVLDRLVNPSQAFKHEGVHRSDEIALLAAQPRTQARPRKRNDQSYCRIKRHREHGEPQRLESKRNRHPCGHHRCYQNGRDGMCVEHLKQLDIRSDERHQIALVSSFELRRARRRSAANTLSRISANSLKAM